MKYKSVDINPVRYYYSVLVSELARSSYSRHDLLLDKVMMQKAWCFMRNA